MGQAAALSDPRPRRQLRPRLRRARRRPRDPDDSHTRPRSAGQRHRRTVYRHAAARMPRPLHRDQRAASPRRLAGVRGLLQRPPTPSIAGVGAAGRPTACSRTAAGVAPSLEGSTTSMTGRRDRPDRTRGGAGTIDYSCPTGRPHPHPHPARGGHSGSAGRPTPSQVIRFWRHAFCHCGGCAHGFGVTTARPRILPSASCENASLIASSGKRET